MSGNIDTKVARDSMHKLQLTGAMVMMNNIIAASLVHLLLINTVNGVEYFSWSHSDQYDSNIYQYVKDNFDTNSSYAFGWKEATDTDSLKLALDPTNSSQYVLQVFYEEGTYSSYDTNGNKCVIGTPCKRGAGFYNMPSSLYGQCKTYASLEYEVYFESGFEFVQGGKLPGLFGGRPDSCKGCSGVNDCFSARMLWRADGHYAVYAYLPKNQIGGWTAWCDTYGINGMNTVTCSSSCGSVIGTTTQNPNKFVPGQWYKIRQEIDLGQVNQTGRLSYWVDDKKVLQMSDIVWRNTSNLYISGMLFSTFYGGGSPHFGEHNDTYTYFRNFRISDDVYFEEYFVENN